MLPSMNIEVLPACCDCGCSVCTRWGFSYVVLVTMWDRLSLVETIWKVLSTHCLLVGVFLCVDIQACMQLTGRSPEQVSFAPTSVVHCSAAVGR